VVVVALILGVLSVPLLRGFGTFTRGMHRSTRQTTATYVAQAIMEKVRDRVAAGSWGELDFRDLAEEGARVTAEGDAGGVPSRYFLRFENLQGTGLHGIEAARTPDLHRQLERYGCRVQVLLSIPDLDSDANGIPEQDMAEVGVEVTWQAPGGGGSRTATLWTLVTLEGRGGHE